MIVQSAVDSPMRLREVIRGLVFAAFPWVNRAQVNARHAETRKVLREARAERVRAGAEIDLRNSVHAIGRRLDGRR